MTEKPETIELGETPHQIAKDLKRFSRDQKLLNDISDELHQMFSHQYVAAFKGIVYTAPTFGGLIHIFSVNMLPLSRSPWAYLVPEEERKTIILQK